MPSRRGFEFDVCLLVVRCFHVDNVTCSLVCLSDRNLQLPLHLWFCGYITRNRTLQISIPC